MAEKRIKVIIDIIKWIISKVIEHKTVTSLIVALGLIVSAVEGNKEELGKILEGLGKLPDIEQSISEVDSNLIRISENQETIIDIINKQRDSSNNRRDSLLYEEIKRLNACVDSHFYYMRARLIRMEKTLNSLK